MDVFSALARIVPYAFSSGINLYATVAVIGLSSRFGLVTLPDQFRPFEQTWVIAVALVMYVMEFVADKIPWVDSAWDALHTVVRPIGGALVAVTALGQASPAAQALAALLGGSLALTTHLTKAGTRAVANTSPEPFSNWALSFGEDLFVVGLTWFAMHHPVVATVIAVCLLAAMIAAGSAIVGGLRRRFSRARA